MRGTGIIVRPLSSPSGSNRSTIALGKGSAFARSQNIPQTQDDINASPRTSSTLAAHHPQRLTNPLIDIGSDRRQTMLPGMFAPSPASSSGLPFRGGSAIVRPTSQSADLSTPPSFHQGLSSLSSAVLSPRESPPTGSLLSVPETGATEAKEGKDREGSGRKKKLAFRKTSIFGKDGKESKHKKSHSVGPLRRSDSGEGVQVCASPFFLRFSCTDV